MSTQTAHLGLHQWESTDSFLREDFNQDNRKIDEKVGSLLQEQALIPLMSGKVTEQVAAIELDLSGIDLSQYCELKLKTAGLCSENTTTLNATFNDDQTEGHYASDMEGQVGGSNTGRNIELARTPAKDHYGGWEATIYPSEKGMALASYCCILSGGGSEVDAERRFGATAATAELGCRTIKKMTIIGEYYDLVSGEFYLYGVKR